jgi:hypothetical protein
LLLLAQGDPAGAEASIGAALSEARWNNLARARLLPAQVEIALAADDHATARAAADEIAKLAGVFASPAIRAAAETARGAARGWRQRDCGPEPASGRRTLARVECAVRTARTRAPWPGRFRRRAKRAALAAS